MCWLIYGDFRIDLGEVFMAAFDRVCSGIPQMDEDLDNIRLGDNVVFRV